jgi:predicted nucleotidyltransferase
MLTKEDYTKTEGQFYEILLSSIKDEICLYCVTGSLGRNEIIPGWSDIDVLIVIKDYKKATFESISNALLKINSEIKIGTTIFSVEEFNHQYFKDAKTYVSIKFIEVDYYKPRVMTPEIKLVKANEVLNKYMDIVCFSGCSHDLKRSLLKIDGYDENKVYKLIIVLLRIMLSRRGIVAVGYKDTLVKAYEHIPNFDIKIPEPEKIMAEPEKKTERYTIYFGVLKWLDENTEGIFQ